MEAKFVKVRPPAVKGAWAKEFDPEYEKANAVVVAEVDVNNWPGLDSTSKERVF